MRLSHITTNYPTGISFLTPGGIQWSFVVLALSAIWNDNIQGACVAATTLAMDAFWQWAIHRYHLRHTRRTATHA